MAPRHAKRPPVKKLPHRWPFRPTSPRNLVTQFNLDDVSPINLTRSHLVVAKLPRFHAFHVFLSAFLSLQVGNKLTDT